MRYTLSKDETKRSTERDGCKQEENTGFGSAGHVHLKHPPWRSVQATPWPDSPTRRLGAAGEEFDRFVDLVFQFAGHLADL